MGDLIGEQVEGILAYVGEDSFEAWRCSALAPDAAVATFADLCRINALYMIARAGSGHIGSSFSSLDIVVHVLLRMLPAAEQLGEEPGLYFSSKGHDAPGLYAALIGIGLVPAAQLHGLRRLRGLPGHPDVGTCGIVANTGSLGMGISKAKGMVRAHRARGERRRIVVLTGDGELQEGQIWESLAGAVHERMDELTVIVDHNKLQSDTYVRATSDLGDLSAKFAAFGFRVMQVDGHDQGALLRVTTEALTVRHVPQVIIADTVKGAGVPFMEASAMEGEAPRYPYHSGAPDGPSYRRALRSLCDRVQARTADACSLPPLATVRPDAGSSGPGGMRAKAEALTVAYGRALAAAAQRHPELWVFDADLAYDLGLTEVKARFPERFVECGIAEMDMVSQAGGAALRGLLPICHSFACFLTPRANEQIYNNASERTRVLYVGGLAGLLPAAPGHSHQGVRDIGSLSGIPGLTCLGPSDPREVELALSYALSEADGPVYLRLCSMPVELPFAPNDESALVKGRGRCLVDGRDGVLFTYGPVMTTQAVHAARALRDAAACEVAVYALPFLNVVDEEWLMGVLSGKRFAVTLDDHYVEGGQGAMLAAVMAEQGARVKLRRLGVRGWPACGAPEEVLRHHGLHAEDLVQILRNL